MAGVAVVNAIVFGVYSQTYKLLHQDEDDKQKQGVYPQPLTGYFIAGVSAGLAQSPVCSLIELAKTRLQLQSSASASGPLQCLYRIHKAEGLRKGVFRGFGTTLMREAPSYGVYFATYEFLTRSPPEGGPISTWRVLLAGGLAGTASWVVSYPIDVVKSRIQADTRYSGPIDCFRKSVRCEGYSCMFRGLNSTIIRAFPTNAVTFAVVTWTMKLFGGEESSQDLRPAEVSDSEATTIKLHEHRSKKSDNNYDTTFVFHSQHQLLANFFALPQNQLITSGKMQVPVDKREYFPKNQHFDESLHFEWTQDVLHN